MKQKNHLFAASGWLCAFVLWTAALCFVDVRPVGPEGSLVGFAGLNVLVHRLTGVHWGLYQITDWLGLIPLAVVLGFALTGLCQWLRRKKLSRVDGGILALGGAYLAVMGLYVLFEILVINYRPVLIQGVLEASYPSSTTVLSLCVMVSAGIRLHRSIPNRALGKLACALCWGFAVFLVLARALSGVHWFSDILGGILLSAAVVEGYLFVTDR